MPRYKRYLVSLILFLAVVILSSIFWYLKAFIPVTSSMLLNPNKNDWLMFGRTYDSQRFSPLNQITKKNVANLQLSWSLPLGEGVTETIPLVYNGVMYLIAPGGIVKALNAENGKMIWEYRRLYKDTFTSATARSKNLAIFDDMIFFTAPDSYVVALDARTGKLRWETKQDNRNHTSGPFVVEGKVISGGVCFRSRADCYISALDAKNGKELWRFYTTAGPDDPTGDASWSGSVLEQRVASTWGLPGSYDPVKKLLYWGIANPSPYTRYSRHGDKAESLPLAAPVDLYSNSTVALNPDTGKIVWYYQHLPGDEWDMDMNQERVLVDTEIRPDPHYVKWISSHITQGQKREIVVNVGEAGGIWALDRNSGEFLWATPFPYDVPNFILSDIDINNGKTIINKNLLFRKPGENHVICFLNTRSYWATAYLPQKNSLYVPFMDNCLNMTSQNPVKEQEEIRTGIARPGSDPNSLNGLAKINLSTGEIKRIFMGPIPSTGSVLATAGELIFWGDLNHKFRAFDADDGKILWETTLGGPISVSTISYGVGEKQFVAVITGKTRAGYGLISGSFGPAAVPIKPAFDHNEIYVFSLPTH